jgi:CHAT domain-containing protein
LLGAGSATLTSGVWAVNIASAARYFALFYEAWLGEGQSRAAAHRAACRELRAAGGALAHPYHWAPFILTAATLAGDVL